MNSRIVSIHGNDVILAVICQFIPRQLAAKEFTLQFPLFDGLLILTKQPHSLGNLKVFTERKGERDFNWHILKPLLWYDFNWNKLFIGYLCSMQFVRFISCLFSQ